MKVRQKILEKLCLLAIAGLFVISADDVRAAVDPFAPVQKADVMSQGENSPVVFTLGVGAGYLTGEATELVYNPWEGGRKVSELTWEIDSLFMFGVTAELEVFGWLTAKLDTWFKATDGEASMDDYDWQVAGGDWTDWSHHGDTDVTDAYIFDLSGEAAFYNSDNVVFSFILGYRADNYGWDARGGDYIYSVSGFRDRQGSFTDGLLGISYEQTHNAVYLGLGTEMNFTNFKVEARVVYAPYVYAEATDHHHLRNLVTYETYDEFGEGDMIEIDLSGAYYFTKNLSLEVGFSYQSYSTATGDIEWHFRDAGIVDFVEDGAGMDMSTAMISSLVKYTF